MFFFSRAKHNFVHYNVKESAQMNVDRMFNTTMLAVMSAVCAVWPMVGANYDKMSTTAMCVALRYWLMLLQRRANIFLSVRQQICFY